MFKLSAFLYPRGPKSCIEAYGSVYETIKDMFEIIDRSVYESIKDMFEIIDRSVYEYNGHVWNYRQKCIRSVWKIIESV